MEHVISKYGDLKEALHQYDIKELLKNSLFFKVDFTQDYYEEIFRGNACAYIEEGCKGSFYEAVKFLENNVSKNKDELMSLLNNPSDNVHKELDIELSIQNEKHMLHIISIVRKHYGYFFMYDAKDHHTIDLRKYDLLTGLYHRFYYETLINKQEEGTMIVFDIDHFRVINTRFGLKMGDEVLVDLANKLKKQFTDGLICRHSADEFLVFIKETNKEIIEEKIGFIIDVVQEYKDVYYRMTAGYALLKAGDDFQSLYRRATDEKEKNKKTSDDFKLTETINKFDLKDIAAGLPGALLVYKATGREEILFANKELLDIFECQSFKELMDYTHGSFKNLVYEDDIEEVERLIWKQVNSNENRFDYVRYRIMTKSGKIKNVEDFGKLSHNTTHGDVFYVFIHDLSKKRDMLSVIGKHAYHDVDEDGIDRLTYLRNYDYYRNNALDFYDTLLSHNVNGAFIYLDIVNFKLYNEKFGFIGGDALLRRFGRMMEEIFKESLIARISEDHFIVLTDESLAHERIKTLHERIQNLQHSVYLDIKAGIFVPEVERVSDAAHACDQAKLAYDQIKHNYQEYECYYSSRLKDHYHKKKYIVSHFKEALNKGYIKTYLQPVVNAKNRELFGFEALSRWFDPKYGMIPTETFVGVLEDAHLVYELDLHTLEEVCQIISKRKSNGEKIYPISVNLSRLDFENFDLITQVVDILNQYQVDKSNIHIEVTESIAFNRNDFLKRQVDLFRFHNLEVWMDDFGSGYSSLNALQEFDFNVIKMDMDFMKNFSINSKSQMIVETIMTMAHKMGLKTLAEGVETEEQLKFLQDCGCDLCQGYLFGKPEPWDKYI